ncbi:MAG: hypothetical protein HY819_10880 [Acidobacteria bacterium]|nr:hypothetical protein [Acidobacteriota bacterium]
MKNKNILSNVTNDDLDFNIEEIEQVIAPQVDSGTDDGTDTGDNGSGGSGVDEIEVDDSDNVGGGKGGATTDGHFTSNTRRAWCC